MERFIFDGEWEFNLSLPTISKLGSTLFFNDEYEAHKSLLGKGMIPTTIEDEIDLNPDPTAEQIKAIKYLQENELGILQVIYNCLLNEICPACADFYPDTKERAGEFDVEALRKLVGINWVNIFVINKNGYAFYELDFSFKGLNDSERLTFHLHKNKIIDYGHYERGKQAIELEAKSNYFSLDIVDESTRKDLSLKLESGLKYFNPLPKYAKLKPWQALYNEYQLGQLLEANNIVAFKDSINNGSIDKDFHCPDKNLSLICWVCLKNKPLFVKFLLDCGANIKQIMIYAHTVEVIAELIKHNVNIDELLSWKTTRLFDSIQSLCFSIKNKLDDKNEKLELVKFLIRNGADLNNCDELGRNYIDILSERYSSSEIEEIGIVGIINDIEKESHS